MPRSEARRPLEKPLDPTTSALLKCSLQIKLNLLVSTLVQSDVYFLRIVHAFQSRSWMLIVVREIALKSRSVAVASGMGRDFFLRNEAKASSSVNLDREVNLSEGLQPTETTNQGLSPSLVRIPTMSADFSIVGLTMNVHSKTQAHVNAVRKLADTFACVRKGLLASRTACRISFLVFCVDHNEHHALPYALPEWNVDYSKPTLSKRILRSQFPVK